MQVPALTGLKTSFKNKTGDWEHMSARRLVHMIVLLTVRCFSMLNIGQGRDVRHGGERCG